MDERNLTESEFLKNYNPAEYPRPSVATDIVIFTVMSDPQQNYRKLPERTLRILLIKRGIHPYLGQWALPGGFVRPGESVGQAAKRELLEETGVSSAYLQQLHTFSEPDRDPRSWIISCAHMALIESSELAIQAGEDACDVAWFQLSYMLLAEQSNATCRVYQLKLDHQQILLSAIIKVTLVEGYKKYEITQNDGLAFDHAKIIAFAMDQLRKDVALGELAFSLMPERFTLTQLQQVYEVILDEKLLKAAFRRKIAALVQETEEFTKKDGHRPSRLYEVKRK